MHPVLFAAGTILLYSGVFLQDRVLALSPKFVACQAQKPAQVSPLEGCPKGTVFVSKNTSDLFAHFHSVQDAILSL